tara:strand:+ start:302 stop:478 length:177 start_codon:yes stop_codon:yes gene_type:complete
MEHISEEANTSEMKPIQIHEEFGKVEEDNDNPFKIYLLGDVDKDSDDDMFLFGVGGPA